MTPTANSTPWPPYVVVHAVHAVVHPRVRAARACIRCPIFDADVDVDSPHGQPPTVTDPPSHPLGRPPLMPALDHARTVIDDLAADRRSRGATITADQLEAAAALLVDLWAAAARHGIDPAHRAWTTYLPRAALDSTTTKFAKRPESQARARRGAA